jgi:hypothetical protein
MECSEQSGPEGRQNEQVCDRMKISWDYVRKIFNALTLDQILSFIAHTIFNARNLTRDRVFWIVEEIFDLRIQEAHVTHDKWKILKLVKIDQKHCQNHLTWGWAILLLRNRLNLEKLVLIKNETKNKNISFSNYLLGLTKYRNIDVKPRSNEWWIERSERSHEWDHFSFFGSFFLCRLNRTALLSKFAMESTQSSIGIPTL